MKKTLSILLVTAVTMFGINSYAQNQGNPGCCPGQGTEMHKGGPCAIPNLTDEQLKKIEPLKMDFQKKKFEIHNQLKVKQAQLVLVSTGDKINKDEAYKIIDEIAVLKLRPAGPFARVKHKTTHFPGNVADGCAASANNLAPLPVPGNNVAVTGPNDCCLPNHPRTTTRPSSLVCAT